MREHMGLYRGEWTETGDWVKGYYVQLFDDKGNVSHRIYPGYAETDCGDYYPDWYEVDPDTVGECTGLRDKNGKLIWEHQKIKREGELYEVRMECGEWRLYDKFDHYCELYKYAGSGEIVS